MPAIEDTALAALLVGAELPADSAALRPLADLLAALSAAPANDELADEASALAVFRRLPPAPTPAPARSAWRSPLVALLLSAKTAVAAAAVAVSLGGLAAAAYTDSLPPSLQRFAHDVIGAPAPRPGVVPVLPTGGVSASGGASPSATGRAASAVGLCTAYAEAQAHGGASQRSAAFRKLVAAAGAADKVTAYCAAVAVPVASPSADPTPTPTPSPSTPPHPSPSTPPHPSPSTPPHPSSSTPPHPTGKPTTTPRPTHEGRPTLRSSPPSHP